VNRKENSPFIPGTMVHPNVSLAGAVQNWPLPTTVSQYIQSVLMSVAPPEAQRIPYQITMTVYPKFQTGCTRTLISLGSPFITVTRTYLQSANKVTSTKTLFAKCYT
jgi:hypothetical protein